MRGVDTIVFFVRVKIQRRYIEPVQSDRIAVVIVHLDRIARIFTFRIPLAFEQSIKIFFTGKGAYIMQASEVYKLRRSAASA